MMTNRIENYLDELFPEPKCELIYNSDYELLIAIVLSAQSTDKRVNSVTPSIFGHFPTLKALKEAKLSDLEDMEPFKLLQSEDEKDIGMVVVSPFLVVEDYEIKLSDEVVDTLEIKSPEEVSLYTTVTINSDVKKITTNLKAPIVINNNNGFAMQIILQNDKYKIKHPIAF